MHSVLVRCLLVAVAGIFAAGPSPAPLCTGCSWSLLADMPTARWTRSGGISLANGKITVMGHHEGNPGTGRINQEYDPVSDTWVTKTPYPRAEGRLMLGSAVVNDEIYYFGGANIWNNYHTRTVDKYDPATDAWTVGIATYPLRAAKLSAIEYQGEIYLFGGHDYNLPSYNAAYRFSPNTGMFVPLANMPTRKNEAGIFVREDKIWLVGGFEYKPGGKIIKRTTDVYDPATDTWATLPGLLPDDYLHWAGMLDNGMIIAVTSTASPDLYVYDLAAGAWDYLDSAPFWQDNFGGVSIGTQIHLIGGGNPKTRIHQVLTLNAPPVADAGPDRVEECAGPGGTAIVLDGLLSTDSEGGTLAFSWTGPFPEGGGTVTGEMPTVTLADGASTITLTVTDEAGLTGTDEVVITVVDTLAPVVTSVSASPDTLWPPNHKMADVAVSVDVSDACSSANCRIISATSNEPDNGLGDGDTANDIVITDDLTLQVRAERAGGGSGRIYTITVECVDDSGNAAQSTTTVSVPKSRGQKK